MDVSRLRRSAVDVRDRRFGWRRKRWRKGGEVGEGGGANESFDARPRRALLQVATDTLVTPSSHPLLVSLDPFFSFFTIFLFVENSNRLRELVLHDLCGLAADDDAPTTGGARKYILSTA